MRSLDHSCFERALLVSSPRNHDAEASTAHRLSSEPASDQQGKTMQSLRIAVFALGLTTTGLVACGNYDTGYDPPPPPDPQATVVSASGAISAKLDEFRALLGDPANGG